MKSSNSKSLAIAILVMALSMVLIALERSRLVADFGKAKLGSDSLFVPPPQQMLVASLGYRAAIADLLYAHTLVWYGEHSRRKRRFEFAAHYIDVITTLDPTFREPYYYADTLITLSSFKPRREDYDAARRLMERGLRARPHDTELWLVTGQFLAYIVPPYLEPEAADEWRKAGARVLAKTCELVGSNENIPFHCVTAARLFDKAGNRQSMVEFLTKVLAVVDDPEIQALARNYLQRAESEQQRERAVARRDAIDWFMRDELPLMGRSKLLILGPSFDPASCAGQESHCVTSFRESAERYTRANQP